MNISDELEQCKLQDSDTESDISKPESRNNADAMNNLGWHYQYVEKNYDKMKEYYQMAIDLNNTQFDKLKIIAKQVEQMSEYMTDWEVGKFLRDNYPLSFADCSRIDSIICGRKFSGGYWREAYNFPKIGDKVEVPVWDCSHKIKKVVSCGYLTFQTE